MDSVPLDVVLWIIGAMAAVVAWFYRVLGGYVSKEVLAETLKRYDENSAANRQAIQELRAEILESRRQLHAEFRALRDREDGDA